jgi:hypothetical protein
MITASESRELTLKGRTVAVQKQLKEILELIAEEANNGHTSLLYYAVDVETKDQLIRLGFQLSDASETSTIYDCISWEK